MIKLVNVTKKIKNEVLFSDINYTFDKNMIYHISGQNGLGKSTLLKIIGGLIKANEGGVEWTEPHQKKSTGFLFDSPLFIHDLSFSDNLRFLGYVNDFEKGFTEKKIHFFAELFKLPTDIQKTVKNYSSGMKRKVELAISLFNTHNCLIWDEPFNFLDDEAIEVILREIQSEERMIIIASPNHDFLSKHNLFFEQISFEDLEK